jgi:hypothetical protein
VLLAQSGGISGRLSSEKQDSIQFAFVSLLSNGEQVSATYSDVTGKYEFLGLEAGSYSVRVESNGFATKIIEDIVVGTNQLVKLDVKLTEESIAIDAVEIIYYQKPLIDKDKQASIRTGQEMENMAVRNVSEVAANSAGVVSKNDGSGELNMRGQRSEGTQYFVDGIKVRGGSNVPQAAVEQLEVIVGGLPAMYGDNMGGVIAITTKGPSSVFYGGFEAVTSELLDPYGYNLFSGSLSGPIIAPKKDSSGNVIKRSPLGFVISGEYRNIANPRPPALRVPELNSETYNQLYSDPLRLGATGNSTLRNAEFITNEDINFRDNYSNVNNQLTNLAGKIDYQIIPSMTLTAGGNFQYNKRRAFIYQNVLFNTENNPEVTNLNYNVFLRLKHRINTDSIAWLSGLYYQVQADWSSANATLWDETHKDDVFSYGHIGIFETTRERNYSWNDNGPNGPAYYYTGDESVLYELVQQGENDALYQYTRTYYDFFDEAEGHYSSWEEVQQGGGLLNGMNPDNVYSLWSNIGRQHNEFVKINNDQLRIVLSGGATFWSNHKISAGVEYERRTDRSYSLNPVGLWTLMRQLSNAKKTQLDTDNPELVFQDGVFMDTVNYAYAYDNISEEGIANIGFYERARDLYGIDYTEFFDVDERGPEAYSLALLTADELYNSGNAYVNMYGYDHMGNRIGKSNLSEFFNDRTDDGALLRYTSPFQPIYMAGFIQDKFEFKNVVFNLGIRVDRYDANQPVLQEPFSLYPIYAVNELDRSALGIPSSIPGDYKVYVNDAESDNPVVLGYRNGDQWYNDQGEEIVNGDAIAQASSSGSITPYLKNPEDDVRSFNFDAGSSFEDYKPQYVVMPRLAFTFNLSKFSSFFAHYDVLAQRPTPGISYFNPSDYLFLTNNVGGFINNPNLKPQRTIDYEMGFQQAVNEKSAVTISAYYREMKDMVQAVLMANAYPVNYITFGNRDFGSVQGATFKYDLRPINSNLSLEASYTLQFANGTGSNPGTTIGLINAGFAELRPITPLDFDQRHTFIGILDYRYKEGKLYNGPEWGRAVLENFGVNLIGRLTSGLPYTGQSNFTQAVAIGVADRAQLDGSVNGSRLPWTSTFDLRVNKYFGLGIKKLQSFKANVYVSVTNLLNAQNIINVYSATGSATDDGFLASPVSESIVQGQTNALSFQQLYALKMANPNNFALPRQIQFGIMLDF